MKLPVIFDATLARELATQIDGCEFRTVKRYFRSPTSEIQMVILVTPRYTLEEVAAVFATPSTQDGEQTLEALLTAGVLTFGVDDRRGVMHGREAHAVLLDEIPDKQACRVIYLPPCYVVQFTTLAGDAPRTDVPQEEV
jgi:hypothetical protein